MAKFLILFERNPPDYVLWLDDFSFPNETGRTAWELRQVIERALLVRGGFHFSVRGGFIFGCWDGECFECVGWGGNSCAGRWDFGFSCCGWDCFSGFNCWGSLSLHCFFSPSLFESLQFLLLLFKLVDVSISTSCSSGVCCFLFLFRRCLDCCCCWYSRVFWYCCSWCCYFFFCYLTRDDCFVCDGDFSDDFFFFPFTWVHSSSLVGWSPVSEFGFLSSSSAALVFIVVVVVIVAFALVVFVAVVVSFWGQKRAKWPSYLQAQHKPWMTTIIVVSPYVWVIAWNPPCLKSWWKRCHRMPSRSPMGWACNLQGRRMTLKSGKNVYVKFHGDVAHGDFDSPLSSVLGLNPEELCFDFRGQLLGEVFRRQ